MTSEISAPSRYFFYSESRTTVFYTEDLPQGENDLIYIGTSNNPIPASAATAFMQSSDRPSGWKVKPLPQI
jgi:hypothetical protein